MKQRDGTPVFLPSSLRLFFTVLVIVFLATMAVHFLIPVLLPKLEPYTEAFADAALMVTIIAPFLWWFLVRPLGGTAMAEYARAATVASSARDGIITIKAQGLLESLNPAAERIFGYGADEVVGKSLTLLMPERYRDGHRRGVEGLRSTGASDIIGKTIEVHGLRKDGSEFPVEVSIAAWRTGRDPFYVGILRDITERKRVEVDLLQNNNLLNALRTVQHQFIANTPPGILFDELLSNLLSLTKSEYGFIGEVLYTPDGVPYLKTHAITNIAWNEETRAFYEKNAPVGMEFYNLQSLFGAVVTSGKPVISNNPFTDPRRCGIPEGHPPLNAFLGLPFYKGEQLVGMVGIANRPDGYDEKMIDYLEPFLATCANIIEAVRNDQRRKHAEGERDRLSVAVEQAGESILITTPDGTIVYVNPAFERMTGYAPAEALGKTPRLLKSGRHDRAFYEALWGTILAGQVWRGEVINRRKDGSLYTVEHCITPVRDENKRITHFMAISQDITAQKELEAQLRQAQKMDAIGQLAGGVAHDFNNLLTVIMGRSELMRGRLEPAHPLRRDLALIHQTAGRAAELTRQLLAFSRKQVIQPKVLDLNAVVAGFNPMLRRLIGEHIELHTVPGQGLGRVKADPSQLEQVILNLAINARDAMPQGGKLTLETANFALDEAFAQNHPGASPGAYVRLAVIDTGVGMDAETQARLFEPFFTTKGVGKGTGLGLSTVYGIIKQHGGYIEVESAPGRGTAVRCYLPRVEEAAEPVERGEALAGRPRGGETILLVEDEEGVRELVREILQGYGYTVLEARDAGEALRISEQHPGPIPLLLTDVIMPEMSGREVAQRLARLRPELRVLYMSGYTDDALAPHGVLAPGTALLEKPLTPDTLARKVRKVLDGK